MLPAVVNGYEWDGHEIEIIRLNDEPLFSARAVAAALGLTESRARDLNSEMEEWKEYIVVTNSMLRECSNVGLTDFRKLNNRGETFLTESGLYEMVLQSRKARATEFRRWITRKVLPTLREQGYNGNAPQPSRMFAFADSIRNVCSVPKMESADSLLQ